jgi:hypothetical protein
MQLLEEGAVREQEIWFCGETWCGQPGSLLQHGSEAGWSSLHVGKKTTFHASFIALVWTRSCYQATDFVPETLDTC